MLLSAVLGILSAIFMLLSAILGILSAIFMLLSAVLDILSAIDILEQRDISSDQVVAAAPLALCFCKNIYCKV
ncbi:hypothetical protein ACPCXF_23030 [Lysinibacillus agricola]